MCQLTRRQTSKSGSCFCLVIRILVQYALGVKGWQPSDTMHWKQDQCGTGFTTEVLTFSKEKKLLPFSKFS